MSRVATFEVVFRKVFDERFNSVFRYVNRMTGDTALAGDIVQEAFVRLYQRGNLPDDPRAWLVTVANNLLRDEHRRTVRRRHLMVEKVDRLSPSDVDRDPQERLESKERRERVRRALERLNERDRQALLLRHEGYTYREIARALDYGETGVGKLIVRATRAFQNAYEEMAHASD